MLSEHPGVGETPTPSAPAASEMPAAPVAPYQPDLGSESPPDAPVPWGPDVESPWQAETATPERPPETAPPAREPTPPPTPQSEAPPQEQIDPHARPYIEHGMRIQHELRTLQQQAHGLDQAQGKDDAKWEALQSAGLMPEQLAQYRQEYEAARNYRVQQYHALNARFTQGGAAYTALTSEYQVARRERELEQYAGPMSVDLLVRDAQKQHGADFPADDLRAHLHGYPAQVLQKAQKDFITSWRKWRGDARAAGRVDDMGPAGGGAGSNFDNYTPQELYMLDFQRARRGGA